MASKVILVYAVFLIIIGLYGISCQTSKRRSLFSDQLIKVTRIGNCPGDHNLTIDVPDMRITQINKTSFMINGFIDVKENITKPTWFGRISVKRCQDMQHIDTCLPFIEDFKDRDVCKGFMNGFLSTDFMRAFKPRFKCPLPIGIYRITDKVVSNGFVSSTLLGTNNNYALTRVVFHYEKRRVLCVDTWIQLGNKRQRKPATKKYQNKLNFILS